MPGYKHPCRNCGKLVENDTNFCPFCGRISPVGSLRCVKCASPIEYGWKVCSHCGLELQTLCPKCGKTTFFSGQCEFCGTTLTYTDPNAKEKKKKWF